MSILLILAYIVVGLVTLVVGNYILDAQPTPVEDEDVVFCSMVVLLWPMAWVIGGFFGIGKLGAWLSNKALAYGRSRNTAK